MRILSVVLISVVAIAVAKAETPPLKDAIHSPNGSRDGIVAAENQLAAEIGAATLAKGGNAVDAAVATGFALAVTHPTAGNVGGGGFMMVYDPASGETVTIDYRETAPAAASRDMYLDSDGKIDVDSILRTHKASGVPGSVAGLLYAHEKFGRLSRKDVMAPAIRLAESGQRLTYYQAAVFEGGRAHLTRNPAAAATFFKADGAGYLPGEVWKQPDLARVLKAVSRKGRDGFYKGWVADAIADDMAANGGLITREDLANYTVVERAPLRGVFRGLEIVAMPPPSSGGVHLIEMLNMLETKAPCGADGASASCLHFIAEIMRRAYADRAAYLGDPDFVSVPTEALIDKAYAAERIADFDPARASRSDIVGAGEPAPYESADTTHYSIIDRDGMMVANTYTLNLEFGSGVVIPGTGILMNNEMDDFSAAPGQPNYFGLVGNEQNAIEPNKRPLSSMTPAFIFRDGEPWMSIGAPGGARIITSVFNVIVNVIDREMNIADAVEEPRIHHQWLPDQILFEPGLSADTRALLETKGHELTPFDWYSRPQVTIMEDGWFYGYSDPRTPGGAACAPDSGC